MIQIRKPDGTVVPVPDACFVELADEDGRVAEVIFQASNFELRKIQHGDARADGYSKLFGVEFIKKFVSV
jgi:hypothetical protein